MKSHTGGEDNPWWVRPFPEQAAEKLKQTRDPLLEERGQTHGDFSDNAQISQSLKNVFRNCYSPSLCVEHREALDMIAMKLSRILSGHSDFVDHWADVAGYAKLAAEACTKK